ncbi:MAG: succinylglutamate desuccinylase/aspartoacylase family protein, partial [Candidatus Latescibacterota bacterium]
DSVEADGVNLNRAFVTGAGMEPALSGITHRLAAFVRRAIWPAVHLVIDLHAGGAVARFAPCASFHPLDDPALGPLTEEMTRWFGTPVVLVYQNRTPGLLTSEAERLGKVTVGAELGWGEAVSPAGVRYGRQGVLAAAVRQGILRGRVEPIAHHADGTQRKVSAVDPACYVPAPFPGLYEPLLDCGVSVRAGQTVGLLHDFHRLDEAPFQVRAPFSGIVVAQAWEARVRHGQHVLVVGEVLD